MRSHKGEDDIMDTQEAFNGCGKRDKKKADKPKEDERISWCQLGRMGMMSGWMEAGTQLGI
jgi:hypothetical protein